MSTAATTAARAGPSDLARQLAWALDPVAWARDRFGFVADPWQRRMLRSSSKRILLNCSRQSGKSTVTAILAAHVAIFQPGALVLLFSKAQRQSSELFAKVAAIFKSLPDSPALETDNLMSCRLVNGSRIVSLPGDAGGVRGFSAPALVLMDEAAYISDELVQAVRPMLAVSNGRFIMMSTPNGRRGAFFHAWSDTTTEGWQREMVSAAECPRIDRAWLETERATVGVWHFSQEYECQFLDSGAQLFSGQYIEAAIIDRPALPIVLANGVQNRANTLRAPMPEEEVTLPGEAVSYVVALDIGQSRDFSALVVAEVRREVEQAVPDALAQFEQRTPWGSRLAAWQEKATMHCHVVFMSRFLLGTPYPSLVADVERLLEELPELPGTGGPPALWLEAAAWGAASRICSRTRDAPRTA